MRLTGVRDDNVQSVRNLLNLLHSLLITLFIIRNKLDDMHIRVLACELVQSGCGRGVASASKDDGVWDAFDEGLDEVVADTSACTGY
jgi:hypothetical protein